VENIKVGGEYQGGWRISRWVENIKVGGEYQAGWRISSWVDKVGGEFKVGEE